ncbi:putative protein [Vanrija pseudolonga]|uniref:Purtative protein n=1 Tax=Vanrija pseudolonga TaxID=143232 RepID=A0AAF0YA90_9TREE|nr:purtative protein [Vanrija pseudolonga]
MSLFSAFKNKPNQQQDAPQQGGEYYAKTLRSNVDAFTSPPSPMSVRGSAALSPPLRSATASPRPKFPADQLRPFIRTLLSKTLVKVSWDSQDRSRMAFYSKELCERIKQRMIEIEPKGYKFIVTSTFSENLGQAGRADLSCHWEDADCAIQEMYSNDTLMVVIIAYAIRV